jgi:hypothetical protein
VAAISAPTSLAVEFARANNQTLVAFGRKPSDRNPTGLHGFHRKYLLVIIDECAGVPEELWEAANSLASNARGRVIAVGNPTDPNSHFAEVCKPGSGWEVQKISAYAARLHGRAVSRRRA